MPITTNVPPVLVGGTCENCGQCCGGTCAGQYKYCRKACYPCCSESVLFGPNLDLPALYPMAKDADGKYVAYDPNNPALNYAEGITQHPVRTDANGRLTNYRSLMSFIPACGEFMGALWTSGEFLEAELAGGDALLISALLSQPSFAKRIPNGYVRIL